MASSERQTRAQITLARALSKLGICSRAQARVMISEGKVRVGGSVVRDPDLWIDLRSEMPEVEEVAGENHGKLYFAFHKPAGIVTTRSDERGRRTVMDLLPPRLPVVFPVGRLDRDTTGLLLFTNDGAFGERVTGPEGNVAKTYRMTLNRPLVQRDLERLRRPMVLRDGTTVRGALVRHGGSVPARYELTITEGKNRQIRRMCEALGYRVLALHRIAIGSVRLGRLNEGELRPLTPAEVASFGQQRRGG